MTRRRFDSPSARAVADGEHRRRHRNLPPARDRRRGRRRRAGTRDGRRARREAATPRCGWSPRRSTSPSSSTSWATSTTPGIARASAWSGRPRALERAGLEPTDARVGDADLKLAIADALVELRCRRDRDRRPQRWRSELRAPVDRGGRAGVRPADHRDLRRRQRRRGRGHRRRDSGRPVTGTAIRERSTTSAPICRRTRRATCSASRSRSSARSSWSSWRPPATRTSTPAPGARAA